MTRPSNRAQGAQAEQDAARYLEAQGLTIVATNFHARLGELDIVAREDDVLCFVEVKARRSARFGTAVEAVTPRKRARLVLAAQRYLAEHPYDGDIRFDVVHRDGDAGWQFLRDAFRPEDA